MREKMASGGTRPFLLALLLTCGVLLGSGNAFAAGGDAQIGPDAAIQAFKLKFGYQDDAAYITARTLAYQRAGVRLAAVAEGEFFYRMSDNTLRCYTGAAWAQCAAGGGGAGTLDSAYQTGRTINRTAATGSVVIQDGTNDAQPSLDMNRTTGTAAVIDISNGGTGNDITSNDWNVTTAGVATFAGVKMADDKDLTLGTGLDAKFQWDTSGTHGLLLDMPADSPFYLCTSGAGCDLYLYSGAVGDLVKFDASAKSLIFTDTTINMGEADAVTFGATGAWSIAGEDAGPLKIAGAVGQDIWVGVDGTGHNLYLFGDTASAQVLWDQAADALTVKGGASVWLQDSVELAFGTAASKVGDLSISYAGGADNILGIERPGAGAVGDIAVETGVKLYLGATSAVTPVDGLTIASTPTSTTIDGTGGVAHTTIFGNASTDIWRFETVDATYTFNGTNDKFTTGGANAAIQMDDTNALLFGTGAAPDTGDVSMAFDGTTLLVTPVAAADVTVDFSVSTGSANNVDVRFNGTTSGDGWFWDGDSETMTMTDAQMVIGTGNASEDVITWGGAKKIDMYHDGTDMVIGSDGFEKTSLSIGNGVWGTDLTWNPGGGTNWKLSSAAGAVALQTNTLHNTSAGINFTNDVTTSPVVSGVKLEQSAGTDLQISSNVSPGGGAVLFGAGTNPLDVSFRSFNGGGGVTQTLLWDWSEDSLSFTDSDAQSWYAAQAKATFGGAVAAPLYTLSSNAGSVLEVATGGAADGTLQIGLNAVNTKITTNFGDVTAAGIQIVPSAGAGTQIAYMVQKPVEWVFLSAAEFMPGLGAPVPTVAGAAYGWLLENNGAATDESVQTFWQPPKWVDTGVDITAYASFSCTDVGDVKWELHRIKITPGDLASLTDGAPSQKTKAAAVANTMYDTSAVPFTIDAATLITTSAFRPIRLEVKRETDDTNIGDCNFYGLNMLVTRKYAD